MGWSGWVAVDGIGCRKARYRTPQVVGCWVIRRKKEEEEKDLQQYVPWEWGHPPRGPGPRFRCSGRGGRRWPRRWPRHVRWTAWLIVACCVWCGSV